MGVLSHLQIKIIDKMIIGKEYTAGQLYCHVKTLGALVREGYAEYVNKDGKGTKADPLNNLKFKKTKDYRFKL